MLCLVSGKGWAMAATRIGAIDGVRGLAALSVAIFHCLHLFPISGSKQALFLKLTELDDLPTAAARISTGLFNGNAAVGLFFVISGFVLSLSLERKDRLWPLASGLFAAKRLVRLYPPMAVCLLVTFGAYVLAFILQPAVYPRPHWSDLALNLGYVYPALVSATYTLFIELGIVPYFAIVILLTRSFGCNVLVPAILGSIILLFTNRIPLGPWTFPVSEYLFMFLLGALAHHVASTIGRLSARSLSVLLIVSYLVLAFARGILGYSSRWSLLCEGLSGAAIVALVAYGRETKFSMWLNRRAIRWMGRISYSFYLYHPMVLAILCPVLLANRTIAVAPPALGALVLVIVSVPTALLLAYCSYRLVESPTMRVSRWLDLQASIRRDGSPSIAPSAGSVLRPDSHGLISTA
jgi:peptidoglycan/LPS O-acetylase OafA/YrhL